MNKFIRLACAVVILTALNTLSAAAEKPFLWQCEDLQRGNFTVRCSIAGNAYLYADETRVVIENSDGRLDTLPRQSAKFQNGMAIYTGTISWNFQSSSAVRITAFYQGCISSADGEGDICLMPEEQLLWSKDASAQQTVNAALPEILAKESERFILTGTLAGIPGETELAAFIAGAKSDQTAAAENNSDGSRDLPASFWAVLLLIVLGGLGLNLTPCILPMIPINLAIIGADSAREGRFRGFRRGAAYGLGITLTYGIIGLLAALTGSRFGALNSSSIFNWVIALIFAALAAAMLGGYDLDLSVLRNLFRSGSAKEPKKQFPPEITAFVLGIAAALLAGACVAPVVISVIVLAAKLYSEGNFGGLLLPFALGLSMALPWPLLGAGLSVLPRPGMWMTHVKRIFGVFIAGMAIYYGYLGWTLRSGNFDQAAELRNLSSQLESAAANRQDVIVDFYASWCKNCPEVEKLLNKPSMQKTLEKSGVQLIKFRAEKLNDPAVKALMDKYRLPGLPALIRLEPKL